MNKRLSSMPSLDKINFSYKPIRRCTNKLINVSARILLSLTQHALLYAANYHQQQLLHRLLKKNQDTVFGKTYHVSNIQKFQEFQQQIPLSKYEDFFDKWIVPQLKGEQYLTTSEKVIAFARTGGTTSRREKYIPLTQSYMTHNHLQGPRLLMLFYQKETPQSQLFTGKIITIGGGFTQNPFTKEKNVGYISGFLQKYTPFYANFFKVPKDDIAFLSDRDSKVEKIIQTTQHQNITAIAGIPLWCEHLLKEAIHSAHKQHIHELRPAFEAFFTGGTRYAPYQHTFDTLWDKSKVQVRQSYNASEGFFAIQTEKNADDMLLLSNQGVFYELISLSDYHTAIQSGKSVSSLGTVTIPLSEAEIGKEYVLVITTDAGLWRYIIGDTIQFTSLSPYKIQITGRTSFFIDAFNEHTLLYHTNAAITQLEKKCHCKVKEYTVGANVAEKRYEWILEFSHLPKECLDHMETVIDEALQEANDNYKTKRIDNGGIQKNKIYKGESGIFEKRLEKKGTGGVQSKVPKLSNDIKIIKEILHENRK